MEAPASDAERLERLLDDGAALVQRFAELAGARAAANDPRGVLELARVAAKAQDPQRGYQVVRDAAHLLIGASQHATGAGEDELSWATWHDTAIELLVPWLEEHPHEPELLNLLGVAIYELGHTRAARRLFEAVREMDPENVRARANVRGCKERMQRGVITHAVPEARTPGWREQRSRAKRLAEVAPRLEPRTISVCMIVKDEEEMLPGCLEAIAQHVDQVVVADTGSTDRTREIAEEFGALVVEFPWNGSFSDARNEALRHCTGDWVLWLDADEHVVEEDGALLRELARRTWIEGFQIVETNFTGSSSIGSQTSHTPMRFFQRRPQYRWQGAVHEQLLWAFPTWLSERFQQSPVRVNHYGYLSTVIASRGKHERNLSLLLEQVAHERTTFTCFNIATEYAGMGAADEAHRWSEEALELARAEGDGWQVQQFAPLMVQRAVTARRNVGDVDGAVQLAEEALQWWPEYTDLLYEQAATHALIGRWEQAAESARAAIAQGDAPARFVSTTGKGSYRARQVLAVAQRHLGEREAAIETLEQVLEEAPHYLETVGDLVTVLVQVHGADQAAARIDALLEGHQGTTAANFLAATAFHEAGAFDAADERYGRVLERRPGHGGALTARAELRLAQERFEDAWSDAMSIAVAEPMAGFGARTAFLAAVVLGDAERTKQAYARISSSAELGAAERAAYRAWCELLAPSGVQGIVPADAESAAVVIGNLEALAKLEAFDQFEQLMPLLQQVMPDERERRMALAQLYIRRRFADLAGEQLMVCAERFGPEADVLAGLGTVATMKEMWDDAEVLLDESLQLEPDQPATLRLLASVREHRAAI